MIRFQLRILQGREKKILNFFSNPCSSTECLVHMAPLIFIDFEFSKDAFLISVINGWTLCLNNIFWKLDFINLFWDIFWQIEQFINITSVIWWKNTILNSQRPHSHNETLCIRMICGKWIIIKVCLKLYLLSSNLILQYWFTFSKSPTHFVKFHTYQHACVQTPDYTLFYIQKLCK